MKLADFVRTHHEEILAEWETFARTLAPAAGGMSPTALRDHADEILSAIVDDMESEQSAGQRIEKSHGRKASGRLGKIGQVHAVLRAESGFKIVQVVAEYRALRASVFRLWRPSGDDPAGVLRFNEAIDEALTDAVDQYSRSTEKYRDQFVAIVGHDLRNPLGGIVTGSAVLARTESLDDRSARIVSRIQNSAQRMVRIVADLLDLTRTRLGAEIPIVRGAADLGAVCDLVVSELEAAHPASIIRWSASGDLRGAWDADRLAQVVSNLLGNALEHGDEHAAIDLVARGGAAEVTLSVHNRGPVIPDAAIGRLFDPLVRDVQEDGRPASGGLGLGLYIAWQIVLAHGGTLEVVSTVSGGTTFTVRLPRDATAALAV